MRTQSRLLSGAHSSQVRVLTVIYSQVPCESAFSHMEKLSSKRRRGRLGAETAGAEMMLVCNADVVRKRVVPALLVPQKKKAR